MPGDDTQLADLLARWGDDEGARTALVSRVYTELRSMARSLLAEDGGPTLQPTALVNEAFLRLLGPGNHAFEDRRHFMGAAARAMRQVLVDRLRQRMADKRDGGRRPLSLDHALDIAGVDNLELLELDQGLNQLAAHDERAARIVELRYFAGLTLQQTAALLDLHPATVSADWAHARAWLQRHLSAP